MDESKPLYARVLLPIPVKEAFTYRIPVDYRQHARFGKRVVVQLGAQKIYSGIIWELHQSPPPVARVKDILYILDDKPILGVQQKKLWEWISRYYMASPGETMNAALPGALKLASESRIKIHPAYDGSLSELTPAEHKVIENLVGNKALTIKEVSGLTGYKNVMPLIKNLVEKEAVIMLEELDQRYKPRKESFLRLAPALAASEDKIRDLLDSFSKQAHRQMEVLMLFLHHTGGRYRQEVPQSRLTAKDPRYAGGIKGLTDKGILLKEERTVTRLTAMEARSKVEDIHLNEPQIQALNQIQEGFQKQKVVLLHGVTSSGKTELYIHLIKECLDKGKQVLYLLPEIALTAQVIHRLARFFGKQVLVYHSRFNEQERTEMWTAVKEKKNNLIVGARSALFLPFNDLGLVIVDEEHDSSFKQYDPAPRYAGRDVAVYMGRMFHANVVLGSATPSIESYVNAKKEKYHYVKLNQRYGNIQMPQMIVADLLDAAKNKQLYSNFSQLLLQEIKHCLEKKQQIILFQNRRGFSLRLQCFHCGWMPQCTNCDVGMTYHKFANKLRCHYCGYTENIPKSCKECSSTKIKMQGFGTEKVEEELPRYFPQAKIARMDLDSARTKNAHYKIIHDFEAKKTDILVGTQMVTKGLDFDNVGLAGVMNMDNMLGFPDFRAFERAFQTLTQVSGRAGRKKERGKVIIQTRQPKHPVIQYAINNQFEKMAEEQLRERKKYNYPPFSRLIRITLKHKNQDTVFDASNLLAGALKAKLGKRVLGPGYPTVARIKKMYLRDILVKINDKDKKETVKKILTREWQGLNSREAYKTVRAVMDVDPV